LDRVWYGLAIAGLVCVLLYVLSQWREIVGAFARRQTRYGSLAILSILIVLGILIGINWVANRQNKRWDLTAGGVFQISEQTRKVLQALDGPVAIRVFGREDDFDRFRSRLNEFEYTSKQVSVEYIDPDKRPAIARQYQVQQYGTAVFEHKGRTERSTSDSEQDLTNALVKIVQGQQKKIYFVQGHGEKDTVGADRGGYNGIVEAIGRENFTVDKLVLAQQPDVPADAALVIVAGPRGDLLAPEAEMLRRYLRKGGKLLLLLDPAEKSGAPPFTNLEALAREWGMEVGGNVVVDVSGMGQLIGTDASVPVAANYPTHPITDRFSFLTAFPLARSVSPIPGGAEGRTAQTFIETSARSWAETNITELTGSGKVALEAEQGDKAGPVSIAAAAAQAAPEAPQPTPAATSGTEAPKPETRVAVVGDSDFASNVALGIQGNRDLFLNIVNWLTQQENMIAIRPREPEDRRITLTSDQQWRIFWLSVVFIPGFVLATGVYTWWRRR
jgi:ABC-type uncharacterized transport system involved in gliding motility auxiliary subunit